jgi:DNA-binding IclR family transcriptional regulator
MNGALSHGARHLLVALQTGEAMTAAEAAQAMQMRTPFAALVLADLVKLGLVSYDGSRFRLSEGGAYYLAPTRRP